MKKLSLGIQDFENLIKDGYEYVDKTEYLYKLLSTGKVYFLSRPRRFGKSLLCSTLASIWEGKKELFKGMYIEKSDWHWEEHPVVTIDLNTGNYKKGYEETESTLQYYLDLNAEKYNVELDESSSYGLKLQSLLKKLHEKYKKRVAIIIDEYDKPLLSTVDDETLHEKNRDILKGFYGALKSSDSHLAFIFVTGVTKFSQVSIFSDLNNLTDISLKPKYASLCGFTHGEIIDNFNNEIEECAKEHKFFREGYLNKLKEWYNGYRFSKAETSVYNPYAVLNHFDDKEFNSYWFQTGTPTYLLKLIESENIDIQSLENMDVNVRSFADYKRDNLEALPVLYQSGYLTIVGYDSTVNIYTLGYPNKEVRTAFADSLADKYAYTNK